jgi:hypothetical protein
MQRLITEIAESITVLMLVYALIVALKYRRNNNLILITIYIVVSIVFGLVDVLMSIIKHDAYTFFAAMYNLYDVFEFCIINTFLFLEMKYNSSRIGTLLCSAIYFSICAIAWFIKFHAFFQYTPILQGIEYIFIAIPSLLLIFEILKSDLITELRFNPDFLIASGLLFYYSLSVPIMFFLGNAFFSYDTRDIYQYLVDVTYVFYAVLIYTFIKAYLCPPIKIEV